MRASEGVEVLNVTQMTELRKDGHPSLYYVGPHSGPAAIHRQDCSHWCLPGVPDAWDELLYALLLRKHARWQGHHRPASSSRPQSWSDRLCFFFLLKSVLLIKGDKEFCFYFLTYNEVDLHLFAFGAMDDCGACKVIKVAMVFEMENLIQTN